MARRVVVVVSVAITLLLASGNSVAMAGPMRFGGDISTVPRARSQGLELSYGTFWLGSWTQKYGWGYAYENLRAAASSDITPVINWWYWGDDISPQCVENGCWDGRQGVWKDKANWYRMTEDLARTIEATMGGRETVVVLETEFNKGGIETYEPFDGYLADAADILHARGNIKVVLGFGNWGRQNWPRFDRAVQSSDLLGMQLLRSSIRDARSYSSAVSTLVSSAQYLQGTFGKPTIVTDLGLSSYAGYEHPQAQVVADLFGRMGELKNAGVQAVLYRMLVDDPTFDTSNYHGEAERHWGLLRADGSQKPAFAIFAEGLRHENGGGIPAPTGPTCTTPDAPRNFAFNVQGALVTLQWSAPASGGTPAAYLIEAGTGPGLANLVQIPVVASVAQAMAPPGTYYVRIRAQNACGVSGASNEHAIIVR